ncbi:hypothetical protein OH491_22055 [Termitidicoccus mucosus]|uniref:hypothetical protein n=1 Tax=Termitidicoccus mucosus TaxID=1184151 RepID=UPI0031845842
MTNLLPCLGDYQHLFSLNGGQIFRGKRIPTVLDGDFADAAQTIQSVKRLRGFPSAASFTAFL